MQIQFQKRNAAQHTLSTFLGGKLEEAHVYDTKTYFLHDVVHYCVEKELGIQNGFWGLLSQGFKISDLGSGKVSLKELGRTEKIVGPVQAFFSGHMPDEIFRENMKQINVALPEGFLPTIVARVKAITDKWRYLPAGEVLELEF